MKKLLLIDADIVAYQACVIGQHNGSWSDDEFMVYGFLDKRRAMDFCIDYIERSKKATGAEEVVLCLTGSNNFRYDVDASYKDNRVGTLRPIGLGELKQWMIDEYGAIKEDNLEADDLMGILATDPTYRPDCKKCIVSEDKDLKTIPNAWLFNPAKDQKARLVSQEEADTFWMCQTLAGDPTDGYAGCPTIGMGTAEAIVKEPYKMVAYQHTFKSGPRKDTSETRYKKQPVGNLWEAIVAHFEHNGLSEKEAILNAQMARILRHGDYNFETKEVKLWTP